jgi:hypothetical protein
MSLTQSLFADSLGLVCFSESFFGTVIGLPHLGQDPFLPAKLLPASNIV